MKIDLSTGKTKMETYYEYPTVSKGVPDYGVILDLFTKAVNDYIPTHVDWGCFLSGGLDSSALVSVASHLCDKPVNTFSVGFSKDAPDLKRARIVAEHLGTKHHEVVFDVQDGIDVLEDVIYHLGCYDITTIRATIPMHLLSQYAIKKGMKCMLSGEGPDEMYAGYLYFHEAPSPEALQQETITRMKQLHDSDLRRGDAAVTAHGKDDQHSCEARFPYFEREFMEYMMSLDPKYKHPMSNTVIRDGKTHGIEKFVFRKAFSGLTPSGKKWLPNEILYAIKAAFSDAVGSLWRRALIKHTESKISDELFEKRHELYPHCTPPTKEGFYYRQMFENMYPDMSKVLPRLWFPPKEWVGDQTDPSAEVLDIHKKLVQ
jgi:asparagine synthase (glutamine-hydrolysing)